MDEIVNKVAQSSLMVFDLEDYYPDNHVVDLDISQWLIEGFILKESDFRTQLKNTDWSKYENKYVALFCATDAIFAGPSLNEAYSFRPTTHLPPNASTEMFFE